MGIIELINEDDGNEANNFAKWAEKMFGRHRETLTVTVKCITLLDGGPLSKKRQQIFFLLV